MSARSTWTPARVRTLLIAGTVLLFLLRVILSLKRSGPVLVADELGYLMNARVLAGGTPGQLALAPFYHGGYSLFLAPVLALTSSPGAGYQVILAINAALVAALFPLLYWLLRGCARYPSPVSLAAAFAGALYPSVTILSQVALSENALFPLVCLWLIVASRVIEGRERWAFALGAIAAALYAVHGSMLATVVLAAGLLVWLGARRGLRVNACLAGLVALAGGLIGVHFLNAFLVSRNYGGHASNEVTVRLDALAHPSAVLAVIENLFGQAWSVLVSTFGLAAAGLLAFAGDRANRQSAAARTVGITLALGALLLLISAASFSDHSRPDLLIYARYIEVVAPELVALGLAALVSVRFSIRPVVAGGALLVLTGLVMLAAAISHPSGGANRWNIASFPFRTGDLGPATLLGAAIVAAIVGSALVWVASRSRLAAALACAALFLPTTAYTLHSPVFAAEDAVYPSGWTNPSEVAGTHHIASVGYDLDQPSAPGHYPTVGDLYVVQWFLPHTRLLLFRSGMHPPPSRFVLTTRHVPSATTLWSVGGPSREALLRLNRR